MPQIDCIQWTEEEKEKEKRTGKTRDDDDGKSRLLPCANAAADWCQQAKWFRFRFWLRHTDGALLSVWRCSSFQLAFTALSTEEATHTHRTGRTKLLERGSMGSENDSATVTSSAFWWLLEAIADHTSESWLKKRGKCSQRRHITYCWTQSTQTKRSINRAKKLVKRSDAQVRIQKLTQPPFSLGDMWFSNVCVYWQLRNDVKMLLSLLLLPSQLIELACWEEQHVHASLK